MDIKFCFLSNNIIQYDFLRFYEEGDAASMVIPRHSPFRKNMDWLDTNFPREVHWILFLGNQLKMHTPLFTLKFYFAPFFRLGPILFCMRQTMCSPRRWYRPCTNKGNFCKTLRLETNHFRWILLNLINDDLFMFMLMSFFFNMNGETYFQWFMWFLVFGPTICFIMSLIKYLYPISPTGKRQLFLLHNIHLNNLLIWWIQTTFVLFDFKKWILKVFNKMLNVELIVCVWRHGILYSRVNFNRPKGLLYSPILFLNLKKKICDKQTKFYLPGPMYPSSCPQASHWRRGCVQCKEFTKGNLRWWWCKNNEHVGWWGQTIVKDKKKTSEWWCPRTGEGQQLMGIFVVNYNIHLVDNMTK